MPEAAEPVSGLVRFLARRRVVLGFVFGVLALWLARPTPRSLLVGAIVAMAGQALRVWAAGHLEKGREVTRTGPYRLVRHPLYTGSAVMGGGLAVAAASPLVLALVAAYVGATHWAATRMEEASLRAAFGEEYSDYAEGRARPVDHDGRRFSLTRAIRTNREHRAMVGLVAAILLLAWKAFG